MNANDTVEVEFVPGHYVTCRVLRVLEFNDGTVELLIANPITGDTEYIYDRRMP